MGQAQRKEEYGTVRRTAQGSGRRGSQGDKRSAARSGAREIEVLIDNRKRDAKTGGTKAGAKKTRRQEQDVELWEIKRDESPRLMRLAEKKEERPRSANTVRRKTAGPQPIRINDRETVRRRSAQAARRRQAKRRKMLLYRLFAFLAIAVCLILIYQTTGAIYRITHKEKTEKNKGIVEVISDNLDKKKIAPPDIIEDFLEVNDFSRPGTELKKIDSVFVHYTANPGTSAKQNRSYFANLAETQERSASAHFIIGYEGELIQCIPLEEQAYAVATRNEDSISIECCYLDEDGKFTQETYDTLIHTLAWLMQEYDLSTDDILRHYDCGGKMCPLYYVEHEDSWDKLLSDVADYEPEETEEYGKSL